VDDAKSAVASALLDARSLKLDYRTEYRGMVRSYCRKWTSTVRTIGRCRLRSGWFYWRGSKLRHSVNWLKVKTVLPMSGWAEEGEGEDCMGIPILRGCEIFSSGPVTRRLLPDFYVSVNLDFASSRAGSSGQN
jgi:hypothetical protein